MHVLPRAAIQNPRVNGDAEPAERPVVIAPVAPRRATISLLTSDLDGLRASASKVFACPLGSLTVNRSGNRDNPGSSVASSAACDGVSDTSSNATA